MDQSTWEYLMKLEKCFKKRPAPFDLSSTLIKHTLISPQDTAYEFCFQARRSQKMDWRISLHHQENNNIALLLRVDYNSGHKNPTDVNEYVPESAKAFAGKLLNESHVHINVVGYKDLAWAIPLSVTDMSFPLQIDSYSEYGAAIKEFMKAINLIGNFTILPSLL
jgi:hypothetical protein